MRRNLHLIWRDLMFNSIVASILVPRGLRWRLLRLLGARVKRSSICAGMWLGSARLEIGESTFINYDCTIDNSATVSIGARCDIGRGVTILTTNHEMASHRRRAGNAIHEPVSIGDGVWIGANVTILPGVRIAEGAVIGAGAVVARDCESDAVYVGTPARLLRRLPA